MVGLFQSFLFRNTKGPSNNIIRYANIVILMDLRSVEYLGRFGQKGRGHNLTERVTALPRGRPLRHGLTTYYLMGMNDHENKFKSEKCRKEDSLLNQIFRLLL